jgi:enoyl-CoA hydratase
MPAGVCGPEASLAGTRYANDRYSPLVAFQHILTERDGPVGVVTMNRPNVLNALSPDHVAEISQAIREFEANPDVRAVVLTGGPKVFAAGADIADMAERTPLEQLSRDQTGRWAAITALTKPLIAAVNGYALGGGCEVALMCDLIVAGDSARFGQPEINLGIIAGAGGTQRWPRTAGKYVAMEINLSGEFITAQRAYQLGLVNKVVPAELTITVARRWAKKLAAQAPIALRLAKESVNAALETPLQQGLAVERRNFYFLFATDDQKEGMRAFLEKRRPDFRGN